MFKQKVSRVLAAFMTLALVVSVMPQSGLNRLIPSAQANLMSPASHSPDSCSDGQNKSKSGSINGSLEPTNTFKVTLSGGVGEVVSIFLPGKGTTNFPADTTVATVSDVSSSGSWVVTYKCEGTGSGSALVNFDSASYNLTSSWTWTTSIAGPATINATLSPATGSYSKTLNPHDISVQAVCNLNGGTFTSFAASGSDTAGAGSVTGSGATRTLTFPIRNTLLAPSLKTNIDLTCTTSVGVATSTTTTFEFVNDPPPATAVNTSGSHSNVGSANFDMPVSSTDVNGDQVTIALDGGCSGQWSLLGTGTNPGTPTATDTVRFAAAQDQFGEFTCAIDYTDDLFATSTATATVTITDTESTVTLTPSDLSAVDLGDDQVVNVAFDDSDDASQTDVVTIVSSDPDVEVYFDDQTTPFTSELITYNGSGLADFNFYILTDPLYAGGETITIASNGSKFPDKVVSVGPSLGGSRLRGDLGSPVIEKQGGTDYSTGLSLDYKTSFGSDLKLSASYDYPTQVRACWKVAVGADGKQIGERVSTSATAGATESGPSMGSPGFGLSLGYDLSGFGLGLGAGYTSDDDFTDESSKYLNGFGFTDWKLGFGLSLGGLYGSGDDVDVDDDDTEFTIPLGSDWKIGAGFDYGLGLNPGPSVGYNTGDKEVDGYQSSSGRSTGSQNGLNIQF